MIRRAGIFLFVILFVTRIANSQHASLEPLKPIGDGWRTDKWGWMSFVAFSADGKQVASDGATDPEDVSGDLSFWSFPEGQLVRKMLVKPTALSPDWKYYATFHGVGEVETGKPLISLRGEDFASYAFSPDSRYVAESTPTHGTRGGRIRLLELPNQKKVSSFGRYAAHSLAISPDGVTLASGQWDVVVLWNMLSGNRVGVLRGFGRYVTGLSFSKDGVYLAAGTDLGGLQIWDVRNSKRITSLHFDGQYVSNPAFSPDGSMVAVGVYGTGTVWLVDVHTGKVLDHKKVSDLGCGSVAFSPDGEFLIVPSTGGIVIRPYDRGGTKYDRGGTIRLFSVKSR